MSKRIEMVLDMNDPNVVIFEPKGVGVSKLPDDRVAFCFGLGKETYMIVIPDHIIPKVIKHLQNMTSSNISELLENANLTRH